MPQRKLLWHSDREKIFVRLSEPPIYIEVLTDGRESANKIIKNNKRNYEYRLSISIRVKGVDAQSAQHRPV